MIHKSEDMQHSFNQPFQIGTNGDDPRDADIRSYRINEGDIVIVGSDGLFDNIYNEHIERVVNAYKDDSKL